MSRQDEFPKTVILGTEVDQVSMEDAVNCAIKCTKAKNRPIGVVKQYVELLDRGAHDPAIRDILNDFQFSVPEGVSVQWAGAYLSGPKSLKRAAGLALSIILNPTAIKKPFGEKFGGTVFTWKLLERCATEGVSIYIVGSPKHSSLEVAVRTIRNRLPSIRVAGTFPGDGGAKIEAALVNDLRVKQPDIVFVAMGFPLQETLISKILPQVDHGVFIGEGGTFDYDSFGGGVKKAPRLVQKIGLEWLWRLILEPSRIKRQWVIPRFMRNVYRYGTEPIKK